MKNKKTLLITVILIAVVAVGALYFIQKDVYGSGNSIFGLQLGKELKNDKIVATVNGDPVYLSDVAIPYFSMNVSYIEAKKRVEQELNDPNTPSSVKESLKNFLVKPRTPRETLNSTIDLVLLYQQFKKEGKSIPEAKIEEEINKLNDLEEYNLTHYPNSEWCRYHRALMDALGIKNNEKLLQQFYKRLQILQDVYNGYMKDVVSPVPTEEEIKNEMAEYNVPRGTAIRNLKVKYASKVIKEKIEELRKTANIKIIDASTIDNLANYFRDIKNN